jgi:hypothetical protein
MTWKKVQALPVGQSPNGTKTYPVNQAHQTRSQWLAPHLSAATVMATAYWIIQVFSTFSSSALAAAARAGPAAYQCVTGTEQVSGSSQGCQDRPRGVQRVQAWSTERAVPVASAASGGRRHSAAGGALTALIGPEI